MTKGFKSSEFWATAIVAGVGLLAGTGLISPPTDQLGFEDAVRKAVTSAAGFVTSAALAWRYIASRERVKVAEAQAHTAEQAVFAGPGTAAFEAVRKIEAAAAPIMTPGLLGEPVLARFAGSSSEPSWDFNLPELSPDGDDAMAGLIASLSDLPAVTQHEVRAQARALRRAGVPWAVILQIVWAIIQTRIKPTT